MKSIRVSTIIAILVWWLASTSSAYAQVPQTSSLFDFGRYSMQLQSDNNIKHDLMFITKYTAADGKDYAIITYGDTLVSGFKRQNTMAWSDDFDLSDGVTYHYKDSTHPPGVAMTPMHYLDPNDPETRVWFSRSFVLGQNIYTYYTSFDVYGNTLGTGLAVIRGISDFNNIPEFARIPKIKFWHPGPYWFDGHPVVKTEADGNTYLYLFHSGQVQRVLFDVESVEHMNAYRYWNGSAWVLDQAQEMWSFAEDPALRATCEWNEYLHKWISIYAVYDSEDGRYSQLAYRTADEITGPWSERTIFYYGTSVNYTGISTAPRAGDCYSPVHRAFYDKDGGRTIAVFFSTFGSQGPIGLYEYTFGHTATTRRIGTIDRFVPQGIDETINVNKDGVSTFYFRDTDRSRSSGVPLTPYPNSYVYTHTDFDASNGLTFDRPLRFKELRKTIFESKAWITSAFGGSNYVGAFYKTLDRNGVDLGTGFAYARGPYFGHFKRAGGTLPPATLASKITQTAKDPYPYTMILNDEDDPNGNVYLARAAAGSAASAVDVGANLTDPSSYAYSSIAGPSGSHLRSWSGPSSANATPLFGNAFKPAVFYNVHAGKWIAIYTARDSAAGAKSQILMRTALSATRQSIVGPWSDPVVLYSVPSASGSRGTLFNVKHLSGFDKEDANIMYFYASDFDANAVNLFEVRLDD
jgi:hypothetical protein